MLHVLYLYTLTSRSTCAVQNVAVFCCSLMSCFLDMLLRYCLSDFEIIIIIIIIAVGGAACVPFRGGPDRPSPLSVLHVMIYGTGHIRVPA